MDDDFLEALADIAYLAGRAHYHSGNSRDDVENFIAWAREFERSGYDRDDYLSEVHKFTEAKLKG